MPETVVITGATGGVGRATARAFAKRGASIGLLARGQDALQATELEIRDLGGRTIAVQGDVADAEAVEDVARRTEAELGAIDTGSANGVLLFIRTGGRQTTPVRPRPR